MAATEETADQDSQRKTRKRLRVAGAVVVSLGLTIAAADYWIGSRSEDLSQNPWMAGYEKAQSHQMGILYGRMGIVVDDLLDDLKDPGAQAAIILFVSGGIAAGFFYLGRTPHEE